MQAESASRRRQPELRAREPADERERLAEGAPGIEVGRERDRGAGLRERPCRVASAVRGTVRSLEAGPRPRRSPRVPSTPCRTRGLEMIDRPRTELDREPDRTRLRELVAVEPELEPGIDDRPSDNDAPARRRTHRARRRRRPPPQASPPPAGPHAAGTRCMHLLPPARTPAEVRAHRARWERHLRRASRGAGRARCRDRARTPTSPRTSSSRPGASSRDGARAPLASPLRPPPGSHAPSRGCRHLRHAAPRSSRPRLGARTPRRGPRRSRRGYDSRRVPVPPRAHAPSSSSTGPASGGSSRIAPTWAMRPSSQSTNASSTTSTSPSAAPRVGADRAGRGRELGQVADQKAWWRRRRRGHVPPPGTDGRSIPLARAWRSASS